MRSFQTLIGLLLVIGTTLAAGQASNRTSEQSASRAVGASSQTSGRTLSKDIHPERATVSSDQAGR
jgi:hypothetical protein